MAKRISLPVSFPSWASITVGILAAVIGVFSIIFGCTAFGSVQNAPLTIFGIIIDLVAGLIFIALAIMVLFQIFKHNEGAAAFWALLALPVFACRVTIDEIWGIIATEITTGSGLGFLLIFYVVLFAVSALLGFLALRGKGFKGLILASTIILAAACIMIIASIGGALAIVYYICAIVLGIVTTVGAFLGK